MKTLKRYFTITLLLLFILSFVESHNARAEEPSFAWPITGAGIGDITGQFSAGSHNGIDIGKPSGTPVYATESGIVTFAGEDRYCVDKLCYAWEQWTNFSGGNVVKVTHSNGWQSTYAHLQSITTEQNAPVNKGDLLGYVGNSGFFGDPSKPLGDHLHFELIHNGTKENPASILSGNLPSSIPGDIVTDGPVVLHSLNPSHGHSPGFSVVLKNVGGTAVTLDIVFLRLRKGNQEILVTMLTNDEVDITINPGQTHSFSGITDNPLPHDSIGRWLVERVEMKNSADVWLPGLFQGDWFIVGYPNWAKHQSAIASSIRNSSGLIASKVVDDLRETSYRWESEWADNQWIEVDLGQDRITNLVLLRWEQAYAIEYRVYVKSSGGNWEEVWYTDNGLGGTTYIVIPNQTVRHIKVELIERATEWGFSLWEIEAYYLGTLSGSGSINSTASSGSPGFLSTLPNGNVTLTFDDGYESLYTKVLPILDEYDIQGVSFITTNFVGQAGHLTWSEIQNLQDTYHWEIGSHTVSHPELPEISTSQMVSEVTQSKTILASYAVTPTSFASPYGAYDNDSITEIAKIYQVHRGFWERSSHNTFPFNQYRSQIRSVENTTTLQQIYNWIDHACERGEWLILVFHDVQDSPDPEDQFVTKTSDIQAIAAYLFQSQVSTATIQEVFENKEISLIPNSSFEVGISNGWTTNQPTLVTSNATGNGNFPEPTNSIKFDGNALGSSLFSPLMSVSSQHTYLLQLFANTAGHSSGEFGFYVDEYDSSLNWISGQWLGKTNLEDILQYSYLYTPSSSSVSMASWQFYLTAGATGSVYLDTAEVFVLDNDTLNASFENVEDNWLLDWTGDENYLVIDTQGNGFSGQNSVRFPSNPPANKFLYSDFIPVDPNNTYYWTTYVVAVNGGNEFGFYIDEYDADENWISGQWKGLVNTSYNGLKQFTYTPTSNSVNKVKLQYYILASAAIEVVIDQVSFTTQGDTTPPIGTVENLPSSVDDVLHLQVDASDNSPYGILWMEAVFFLNDTYYDDGYFNYNADTEYWEISILTDLIDHGAILSFDVWIGDAFGNETQLSRQEVDVLRPLQTGNIVNNIDTGVDFLVANSNLHRIGGYETYDALGIEYTSGNWWMNTAEISNTTQGSQLPYFDNGDVYSDTATGNLYILAHGIYSIPNTTTMQLLGWTPWTGVSGGIAQALANYERNYNLPDLSNEAFVKGSSDNIYYLDEGKRLIPTWNDFVCLGGSQDDWTVLPDDVVEVIPTLADITCP